MLRRTIAGAILTAAAALAAACGATRPAAEETPQAPADAVVGIVADDEGLEGSGVVWDAAAELVVTAAHVVGDDHLVVVRLADGREAVGRVVGVEERSDVALVRVEGLVLPAGVPRGGRRVARGDPVTVVGRPPSVGLRTSRGRVEARDRTLARLPGLEDLLSLDALASPGDSGGAVLAADGSLAGLVLAADFERRDEPAPALAIPVERVESAVERLLGDREAGFLGIDAATVTAELAETHDLASSTGVAVMGVQPGSPADDAGLRYRDVLVAADGAALARVTDLDPILARLGPGGRLALQVERDGARVDVEVELGERLAPPG